MNVFTEYQDLVEFLGGIAPGFSVAFGEEPTSAPAIMVIPAGDGEIEPFNDGLVAAHDRLDILITVNVGEEASAMEAFEAIMTKLPTFNAHEGFELGESYSKQYADNRFEIRIPYRIVLRYHK